MILKRIIIKFVKEYKINKSKRNRTYMVKYLKELGIKIGKGSRLNCAIDSFGSEPYLITIGENCLIAQNVKFITHDGAVHILNSLNYFNGKKMDNIAPINIGNNVYIGMNAMIMPGVSIGNNVIIGAGSIVTKNIDSDSVVVGVPARKIGTIKQYYENNKIKNRFYPTAELDSIEKRKYFKNLNL